MNAKPTTYRTTDLIEQGLLEIGDGYRAKNSELAADGLPFARAGNIDDGFQFDGCDRFPLKDISRVGTKVSAPGDVVFTSKGTVGRFAFVRDETPQFVYSPQLCFWRSTDINRLDPRFLFCWMRGDEFWEQAAAMKGQTDMADYVSLRDQRRMQITLSFALIQNPPENMVVSTGFATLTPTGGTPAFIYAATTTEDFTDYLTAHAEGSAYPAVRPETFEIAQMVVSPPKILKEFEKIVSPWMAVVAHNIRESQTLAALRDTLLPKLLSGELRVKQAEKRVEARL